jgi:hypothetical protein
MLKISLSLNVLLEIIQNLILPQLKPKHVDTRIVRVEFLNSPPRPIIAEDGLDQRTIVALPNIEDIMREFLSNSHSQIVGKVYECEELSVLFVLIQYI